MRSERADRILTGKYTAIPCFIGIMAAVFYLTFKVIGSGLTAVSPLAAASLLTFCLLYTPCVAAIASIRRELGGKWAVAVVVGQCVVAWIAAFLVRGVGLALGLG